MKVIDKILYKKVVSVVDMWSAITEETNRGLITGFVI